MANEKRHQIRSRCFKCHKKGHLAKSCPQNQAAKTTLADLPIELLELIGDHLVEVGYSIRFATFMLPLRLVCRSINSKLHNYFGRKGFGRLSVHISYGDLQRISEIAQSCFAKNVETLHLCQYDEELNGREAYENAVETVNTPENSRRIRKEMERQLWRAHHEQDDKAFVERSGTLGIQLTLALLKMPNVRTVTFLDTRTDRKSLRRGKTGKGESTAQVFSTVVASLSHANVKPHDIRFFASPGFYHDEGVSLQALSMPRNILDCFSELRNLELVLETKDDEWKNPRTWDTHAGTFLASCQKLASLTLGFRNQWSDTERVFAKIASKVYLPALENLVLFGIRCGGKDLGHFLSSHKNLQTLRLENLDVTGSQKFADVLKVVEEMHDCLKQFSCRQIAQDSFRTFFETLGSIEMSEDWHFAYPQDDDDKKEEADFFNSFVRVQGPFKYHGEAEELEGVQNKVGLLRQDLRISHLSYQPEFGNDSYWWMVQP